MKPFPSKLEMRWRRLNGFGREHAAIQETADGWCLKGQVETETPTGRAQLVYVIDCERDWRTRRTLVTGSASGAPVRFEFAVDREGHWTLNGAPVPTVDGVLDIDLGFTPATNLLPIRRLDLAVGQRAPVRAVWLRFPELRVDPLEQWYWREAARVFRYDAVVDGERYQARLDTDEFGCILIYEGLWETEVGSPSRGRT
jgi:uncharacterized protein